MNIKRIEEHLSDRLGLNVEVTIRGEKEFTFSIDNGSIESGEQIIEWFKQVKTPTRTEMIYDDELETMFVYIDIN